MNGLQILKQWLKVDYDHIASKLGFIKSDSSFNEELLKTTIRFIDSETSKKKRGTPVRVDLVISIIALMWEHTDHKKYNLENYILKMLSRIGYPSSAIITDKDYDSSTGKFSAPGSFLDYLFLPILQRKNEVTINNDVFLLTEFQRKLWDKLERFKYTGISAPTSAGKSFVILLYTVKKIIKENCNVIYIVPTLSLVNQVSEDYTKLFHKLHFNDYIVTSGSTNQETNKGIVYVWTQEKAVAALSGVENNLNLKETIFVVDEIQNIERISYEEDERSKVLYDVIQEFRHFSNIAQVIISGPRINQISELIVELFGTGEGTAVTTEICPVFSITYSISIENNIYYFKQYCALLNHPFTKEIENPGAIAGLGSAKITDEYISYLTIFTNAFENAQNIIFAPTPDAAREIACSITVKEPAENSPVLQDLIQYYKSTVNEDYMLCKTLLAGIAYHHGKLPVHVRRTLEKAIQDKMIANVVCTTTLIQGVNIPAQNIIIRNPHLYTKRNRNSAELTSYEMANLRGRAGRLLKDFVGRTFVLDEGEFANTDGYEGEMLFDEVRMNLHASYGEKYEQYKEEILPVLNSEMPIDVAMHSYGHLATYIRQSILKYGEDSATRMSEVGVNLTPAQVAAIKLKLENLKVPRQICIQNRYWDPFVLDKIYTCFQGKVPSFPEEKGVLARINEITKFLRDNPATSIMYKRYIPSKYQRGSGRKEMCRLGIKWACGIPLSELLKLSKSTNEDAIDNTIQLLQDTVSYSLPLLLKPLFEMKNPKSTVISCLQAGSCSPYSRKMIEIGIPRELALSLEERFFKTGKAERKNEGELEEEIRTTIKNNSKDISYWEKVQLEFML